MSAYTLAALVRKKDGGAALRQLNQQRDSDARDDKTVKEQSLRRVLKLHDLLAYGVGSTVGAGIYNLIGVGTKLAGSAILVSFLIGALSCVFTGLVYSEFSARVPEAGSAYTFSYTSFGEIIGFMIGWSLTMEYAISAAAISRGFGSYFLSLLQQFGIDAPEWLAAIPLGSTEVSPLAGILVVACTLLMIIGVKKGSTFNVVVTLANCLLLTFFVVAGATLVKPANWVAVSPMHPGSGGFAPYGIAGIFSGAGTVFFSYLGFDMVTSLAEEVADPQRDMPLGILGSLGIAATIYAAVSLVCTGMIPWYILNGSAPLAQAFIENGWPISAKIISFGSILGTTTATLTCLMGQPRLFFRMSADGLMFPVFSKLNPKSGVPMWGSLIIGLLTAVIALFTTLEFLASAVSLGAVVAAPMVATAIWTACLPQNKINHLKFKCPGVPFIPMAGITINVLMMVTRDKTSWIAYAVWFGVGLIIYFGYGIRKSKLRPENQALLGELNDPAVQGVIINLKPSSN